MSERATQQPSSGPQRAGGTARILLVTATAGYVHESIPTARRIMRDVIARPEDSLAVETVLEDVAALDRLTPDLLAEHQILCLVHTSGTLPLGDEQKQAILDFVAAGNGFVGVHGATTINYEWVAYGEMIGAHFLKHPPAQPGTVIVEDSDHPSTRHLAPRYDVTDEFYTFRTDPRERAHVLLRADPAPIGLEGDLPLAWAKPYGSGRVYYNALGHFDANWEDPAFQAQIRGGLGWVATTS
jgi:type 1 glutamine amidotransferase